MVEGLLYCMLWSDCDFADRDLAVIELGLSMNAREPPSGWIKMIENISGAQLCR
jgi:hypothetical protein